MDNFNNSLNQSYNVVFDENKIDNRKKKHMMIIILIIASLILVCVFLIFLINYIKGLNEYKVSVEAPGIVYMGESINVTAKIEGTNQSKLSRMETSFLPSNEYIFYALEEKTIGNNISNVIVPIQEGNSDLLVSSYIDDESVGESYKNITVCPSFDKNLLSSSVISVVKGAQFNLNIDFGEGICSKGVLYAVSDNDIATIDSNGTITGLNIGTTTLIVKKDDRMIEVPLNITSSIIKPTLIQTNISKIQLMSDENYRLQINPLPTNSTSFNYGFTSSNEEVATVSESGLIKAGMPGMSIITVSGKTNALSKKIIVIVDDMNEGQQSSNAIITQYNEIKIKQGMSKKLFIEVRPDTAINHMSLWNSGDSNIAYIDSNGVVYAKNIGSTYVTVTNGVITKNIKVTVEN